jgi:hypothetical protein
MSADGGSRVARYNNEVELRGALGIESWRHLSKDAFLRFLDTLPDTDPQVALQLVGQLPELTSFARATLDDVTNSYETALVSSSHGLDMVHQIHLERLQILKAELAKDLTPEERLRVLDDMREINLNTLAKDTENKRFLSDQLDKKLGATVAVAATVAGLVLAAAKSGKLPAIGAGKLFKS